MNEKVNFKIQNILWPQAGICSIAEMYFRCSKGCLLTNGTLHMTQGAKVTSDTYFNGVSVDKWKKYTQMSVLQLSLSLKGRFRLCLCSCERVNEEIVHRVLHEEILNQPEREEILFSYPEKIKGMAYFSLEALDGINEVYGGYYSTFISKDMIHPVKIGIAICTFKREEYLYNNLTILKKLLIENPESELYGNLEVFVSDNGKSLDPGKVPSQNIHIFPNKNAGGAAGFTRCMIEALQANKSGDHITHLILMDDDITIEPESLLKTYRILSILKPEYKDAFIGGAMLQNDKQNMQVESGAFWNGGQLISLKHGLDMSKLQDCLYNEVEEAREYNAWWYCCIPMTVIREDNLPLPIFIRGDDVEYGLRNTKNLILMNGICVWHEPFENKYSSFLSYYILRNQLIDNSLHYPKYGKRRLKHDLYSKAIREIMYYRYKNVDLLIRGVRDYLKGIDWLLASDGEALHQEIMAAGYKAEPVDQLSMDFFYSDYIKSLQENDKGSKRVFRLLTLNGYLLPSFKRKTASMAKVRPYNAFRAKQILYYDVTANKGFICKKSFAEMIRCVKELIRLGTEINKKYNSAKQSYRKRQKELQNEDFWRRYLELN